MTPSNSRLTSNAAAPSAILVAGSANLDFVVRANHVPAPGETVLGDAFATFPGGKGANQAVACARAGGVSTQMLLALGNDAYALPLEASLRDAHVALHIVRSDNTATGTAFVCIADNAENAITVAPGANNILSAEHLPALDAIGSILLQLETPLATVMSFARAAREAGVRVILNAAPARALPLELLALLDVLIVNEGELAAITGAHESIAAALQQLDVPCVIVTLGARGSCAHTDQRFHLQHAFAVDAIDTTGAGDTFCGVFVASLAHGLDVSHAQRRACAASALACTVLGAQASIPTTAQIDAFLRHNCAAVPSAALAHYCGILPDQIA